MTRRAFTLIELLVTLAVISLLIGLLVPALAASRNAGRTALCLSNQRQLILAWALYAGQNKGRAMPLEFDAPGALVYWFGSVSLSTAAVDHDQGFIAPHLDSTLRNRSVFECPSQPWGTYRAQPIAAGPAAAPTSTYGYNGYYLCPAGTPGWRSQIGAQRWKSLADIERPSDLFVYADTLLPGTPPINCALLDPPLLYDGVGGWDTNPSPTTCFRHARARSGPGSTATARADGSARAVAAEAGWITDPQHAIGSAGTANDPHYIPDWKSWR